VLSQASPVDWSRHFSCNQLHKTSDTAERQAVEQLPVEDTKCGFGVEEEDMAAAGIHSVQCNQLHRMADLIRPGYPSSK
jgi:hypothetical protein